MCLFKERHSNLASYNAQVGSIRRLEELVEDALFLRGQIQVWVSLCYSSITTVSLHQFHIQSVDYTKSDRCATRGQRMLGGAPGGPPELRRSSQKPIASSLGVQNKEITYEYQPWLCVERRRCPLRSNRIRIVGSLGGKKVERHGEAVSLAGRVHEHGLDQAQL